MFKRFGWWLVLGAVVLISVGFRLLPALRRERIAPASQNSVPSHNHPRRQPAPASSESPDPAATWKTWTNTLASVSIKYPATYSEHLGTDHVLISSPPTGQADKRRIGVDSFSSENDLRVELYVEKAESYSVERIVNVRKNPPGVSGFQIVTESKIILDGIEGVRYSWTGHWDGETIVLVHNGYQIEINKYPLRTTRQKEFEGILSTLKSLN